MTTEVEEQKSNGLVRGPGGEQEKGGFGVVNPAMFRPHMTLDEARNLQVDDKLDHRDSEGRSLAAVVREKSEGYVLIHYEGYDDRWDEKCDYEEQLWRFAVYQSISRRHSKRYTSVKMGFNIEFRVANTACAEWTMGTIDELDKQSGQVKVKWGHNLKLWVHLDNPAEVRRVTKPSVNFECTAHSLPPVPDLAHAVFGPVFSGVPRTRLRLAGKKPYTMVDSPGDDDANDLYEQSNLAGTMAVVCRCPASIPVEDMVEFSQKVEHVQQLGAAGALVLNVRGRDFLEKMGMGSRKENITIPAAFMRNHEVGDRLIHMLENDMEVFLYTKEEELEPSVYWKLLKVEGQLNEIKSQLTAGHQPNLVDVERQLEELDFNKNNLINHAKIELGQMENTIKQQNQGIQKSKDELTENQGSKTDLESQIALTRANIDAQLAIIKDCDDKIRDLQSMLTEAQKTRDGLERDLRASTTKSKTSQRNMKKIKKTLKSLESSQSNLQGTVAELRKVHTSVEVSYELLRDTLREKWSNFTHGWAEWTATDVVNWINRLNNGMFEKYTQKLREAMEGDELSGSDLSTIENSDLISYGINKIKDRKYLLDKLRELTEDPEAAAVSVQHQENIDDAPVPYCGPITQLVMEDPVTAADGHTYERSAISEWMESKMTSPVTGMEMSDKTLRSNHLIKSLIQEWHQQQKATRRRAGSTNTQGTSG